ncbi:MAG: hypothetical protein EBX52_04615 [Proteobacteria bacterium]|nr:hypothetical protein [Pseudomonadota bacterium]
MWVKLLKQVSAWLPLGPVQAFPEPAPPVIMCPQVNGTLKPQRALQTVLAKVSYAEEVHEL